MKRHARGLSPLLIAAACIVVAFVTATFPVPSVVARAVQSPSRPVLTDLRSVDELKTLFNRDAGKFRIVLLLSPT